MLLPALCGGKQANALQVVHFQYIITPSVFSSQKSKLFASFAHAAAEYAYSRVGHQC